MKKSGLMIASLALFSSAGYAAGHQASYAAGVLSMPHVMYMKAMYDVKMSFHAPDELRLMSATPLTTMPDNPMVKVSDKLKFKLTDIHLGGDVVYRADVSNKDGKFTAKKVMPIDYGIMMKGANITNLGILADGSFSYAYSVSNDGKEIVGRSRDDLKKTRPARFHFMHGHIQGLKGLGNSKAEARAEARGVNNTGVMAGFDTVSKKEKGKPRIYNAFYNDNTNTDLVNLGTLGGLNSRAYGINNNGMIVGWSASQADDSDHVAFTYDSAGAKSMTSLGGNILGGSRSFAFDVNDSNQVTGVATTADGSALAFLYQDGAATSLGSIDNSGYSEGRAINAKGQVTGWSLTASGSYAAFIADASGMQALPGLGGDTKGYDINVHGSVVGSGKDADGKSVAFLYKDGSTVNLYDLLPAGDKANWKELREAFSISDDGVIVGRGRYWTDKAKGKNSSRAFRIKF